MMNKVIEKMKDIREIQKQNEYNKQPEEEFNLFGLLRKQHDEKYLHSNFIAELLKLPEDSGIFLKLFLKHIGLDEKSFDSRIEVLKEYKNIDIFLRTKNKIIIIENKINARDQPKQLERYYKEIIKEIGEEKKETIDIEIFYLTLDGKDPTKNSLGKLLCNENDPNEEKQKVKNISYKQHISQWIEESIQEYKENNRIKQALIQYLEVVNNLTGILKDKDYLNDISNYLFDSAENIKLGRDIHQGYEKALTQLRVTFWEELENTIKEDHYLKELEEYKDFKYSKNKIETNKDCGLLYYIQKLEDGNELWLTYETEKGDDSFYFGFQIFKEDDEQNCSEKKYEEIRSCIHNVIYNYINKIKFESDYYSDYYLAFVYPKTKINYLVPDDEFFKLTNKTNRREFIKTIVDVSSAITAGIAKKLSNQIF